MAHDTGGMDADHAAALGQRLLSQLANVVAFALAKIPMVSFLIAPVATQTSLDNLQDWMHAHRRLGVAVLGGHGGYLPARRGISKL